MHWVIENYFRHGRNSLFHFVYNDDLGKAPSYLRIGVQMYVGEEKKGEPNHRTDLFIENKLRVTERKVSGGMG